MIGIITVRISVIYGRISHQLSLEEPSIGNCGCDHSNPYLGSNLFPEIPLGHTLRSPVVSLKVFALNFTRLVIVLDVPLSIPVPSVRVLTE